MIWWSAAFACPEPGAPDAPFDVWPSAPGVHVLVEVWAAGAPEGWADGVLDALDAHGVPALVVVPARLEPSTYAPLLARVGASPHALGIALPEALVPTGDADVRPLRRAVAPLAKAAGERPRAVVSRVGSRTVEGLLQRAGYRVLVDAGGVAGQPPRVAGYLDGQAPTGVVVPPGPWDGDAPARCAPFGPATADHLARTLERAVGIERVPMVRWVLEGRGGGPDDAAVVDRWLTEVGRPSGATFGAGDEARAAWLDRSGGDVGASAVGGRGVPVSTVRQAAAALAGATTLPATLPGDLDPTEAFLAFALVATGRDDGIVHLPAAGGPIQNAASSAGPGPVDRQALVAWARDLLADVPTALPSAARIGDRVLPAREILFALASLVRGEDPVVAGPVADPDPNAPGLGWGRSGS